MEYIFKRKNKDGSEKIEEVEKERWGWSVLYKDGSELHQFDENLKFHQFKEIEMDKVKLFCMNKLSDPYKWFYIPVNDRIKIFHFYRNIRPANSSVFYKIYVFGYKFKGSNKYDQNGNVVKQNAVYNFILPDDKIITSPVDNVDLTKFGIK